MRSRMRALAQRLKTLIAGAPPRDLRLRYPQHAIGAGTYGSLEVKSWGEGAKLRIGAYCSFAHGVRIFLGGEHRTDWVTTYPFNVLWPEARHIQGHPMTKGDVTIGNDVWVGTDAIITSGVTIGSGAVVGARAVVTRDVPPYGVVVGNPARIAKYRFDEDVVARLLAVGWWDWPDAALRLALPDLLATDIHRFLAKAEAGEYFDAAASAHPIRNGP